MMAGKGSRTSPVKEKPVIVSKGNGKVCRTCIGGFVPKIESTTRWVDSRSEVKSLENGI